MQIQRQTFSRHRARSATLALAGVFAAILTTGCGAAAPGNAEAKNFLEGRFSGCPLWTISNARKIDSVQRGDKYQLDYEATLTIREDFARSTYASVRGFVDDPRNKLCMGEMGNVVAGMAGSVNPQTRQTVLRGAVLLIQSEQGWRLLGRPQEEFVMPGH